MRLSVSWRSATKIGMKDDERFVFADLWIWKGWDPTTGEPCELGASILAGTVRSITIRICLVPVQGMKEHS